MTALNNRKIVSNSFNNGLDLDSNPMVISNDCLTNCLNGTLITHNGNEFILQNDMGNGRVESAGLPPGYVPVGMKEFGGIVYVASKNVLTGDCQIGTFPSPERNIGADEIEGFTIPPVPTIVDFCQGDEIVNDTITTRIYPNPLKPGDKFKVNIPNTEINKTILQYELGVKTGTGIESRQWIIWNVDDALAFANDENYPPSNYEENSKGELYLITKVKMPHDIDLQLIAINNDSELVYTISGEANQHIYYKIQDVEQFAYLDQNGNLQITKQLEPGVKTVTISVSPIISYKIDSNNTVQYKIKSMTKTMTTDIELEKKGINLNQWRYSYNEARNQLELTYGFSGGLNTKYVQFNFYQYQDLTEEFGGITTIEADAKSSYSGQFTDLITNLIPHSLYMCEIVCKSTKTAQDVQGTFYKLVWTNDLFNQFNLSQEQFDLGYINLKTYIDGNTDIDNPIAMTKEPPEDGNDASPKVYGDKGTEKFEFSVKFSKNIKFKPYYYLTVDGLDKLPFDGSLLKSEANKELSRNDSKIQVRYTIKSNNTTVVQEGFGIDSSIAELTPKEINTGGDIRDISIYSTYYFHAQGKDVEGTIVANAYVITKYLDETKTPESGQLTDMQKIFGSDDGIALGLCIATGQDQRSSGSSKNDDLITSYGLLHLNNNVKSGDDFEGEGSTLQNYYTATSRDYDKADRDWKSVINGQIVNPIRNYYEGYVPPICCIGSFRKYDWNYGGTWMDGKDKNEFGGQIGWQWMDYTLASNYSSTFKYNSNKSITTEPYKIGGGYRNYIIPLWSDGESYKILIDSATLLDKDLEPLAHPKESAVHPAYGKSIVEPLKNIFKQLYVHDPKLKEPIVSEYAIADSDNFSYTKEISGDIVIKEIIKFNDSIRTSDKYNYDLYNTNSNIYLYRPNNKIDKAVKAFLGVEKIPSDFIIPQILFDFPDIVENEYQINVPACNVNSIINAFKTANNPNATPSSGVILEYIDDNNVRHLKQKQGDGESDFQINDIYIKDPNSDDFYSIQHEKMANEYLEYTYTPICKDENTQTWGIKIGDLAQYLTVGETKDSRRNKYKVIYLGQNCGMESKDFEQNKNLKDTDYSKLPYIGLIHADTRGGDKKDYSEQYPFSFVKGYYLKKRDTRNAQQCVPLMLFADRDRIRLSKNVNNNDYKQP